jgi:beta-RFAP synthase
MEASDLARMSAMEASAPCDTVRISTSARLHFGFLDPSGRGERPFGSFGLAIDRPQTRLTLKRAPARRVTGVECDRAGPYLRTIAANLSMADHYHLHLDEAIPSHAGLGSGTQLALAIGAALASLEGLPLDLADIAATLERGRRSGIGIGTFGEGGAVLDGGPGSGDLPPILVRVPIPADWRALLIFDPDCVGLSGAKEIEAFALLPDFPAAETAELARRVTEDALPALAAADFHTFSEAVGAMQRSMGAYFAPLQGSGPYVSKNVARMLDILARRGVTGIGQSSWGPTGFAFAPSQAEAERLLAELTANASGTSLRFDIVPGRNEPATIERLAGSP